VTAIEQIQGALHSLGLKGGRSAAGEPARAGLQKRAKLCRLPQRSSRLRSKVRGESRIRLFLGELRLLHCSLPLHRAIATMNGVGGSANYRSSALTPSRVLVTTANLRTRSGLTFSDSIDCRGDSNG